MAENFMRRAGTIARAGLAGLLLLAAASTAHAQRWQNSYGGVRSEAGRGGVLQLVTGGYAAVGESFTPVAAASDIYVVVTSSNGALVWSSTYNIGGNDSATSVRQCANGDLIVCGVTQNVNSFCAATRDVFLLRLNSVNGAVIARMTYGTPRDEIAWDVIETRTGNGMTTFIGDFVVAGSTTISAAGPRDALLIRTRSNLNLIWSQQYGGTASNDEYFYGLDEATIGVGAGVAADIVATGATNTFGVGNYDILVARVSGQNGTIGAAPQNVATFGTTAFDEGREIRELKVGANAGNLVIVGATDGRPAPSTSREVDVLLLRNDPCVVQLANLVFGDNATRVDAGFDIREVQAGAPAGLTAGNLIVTGNTNLGGGTVTGQNVFLQEISPAGATLNLVGVGSAFGGTATDAGWSVNIATRVTATETAGYIVCGFTESAALMPAGDVRNLYLIKTNTAKNTSCNFATIVFQRALQPIEQICIHPVTFASVTQCQPTITPTAQTWIFTLCFVFPSARDAGGHDNDGVSGVENPAIAVDGLRLYPNPVASGAAVNLRIPMVREAHATVTVTDMLGRVVYSDERELTAGEAEVAIATAGWAHGGYLVDVAVGKQHTTARVVVMER